MYVLYWITENIIFFMVVLVHYFYAHFTFSMSNMGTFSVWLLRQFPPERLRKMIRSYFLHRFMVFILVLGIYLYLNLIKSVWIRLLVIVLAVLPNGFKSFPSPMVCALIWGYKLKGLVREGPCWNQKTVIISQFN